MERRRLSSELNCKGLVGAEWAAKIYARFIQAPDIYNSHRLQTQMATSSEQGQSEGGRITSI